MCANVVYLRDKCFNINDSKEPNGANRCKAHSVALLAQTVGRTKKGSELQRSDQVCYDHVMGEHLVAPLELYICFHIPTVCAGSATMWALHLFAPLELFKSLHNKLLIS